MSLQKKLNNKITDSRQPSIKLQMVTFHILNPEYGSKPENDK